MRFFGALTIALLVAYTLAGQFVDQWLIWSLTAALGASLALVQWIPDIRRNDPELGPVMFAADVQFRVSRERINGRLVVGGTLLTGNETVATRARFFPHAIGKMVGVDYTLDARDFEVDVARTARILRAVGTVTFKPSHGPRGGLWDESVILRGSSGKTWLELEFFRSATAKPEDVRQALIRAGARPAERNG